MKLTALIALILLTLAAVPAHADGLIGGIFFRCSYDPDRERHFVGMPGNDSLEPEARKAAAEECDRLTGGGSAVDIVYVYKDGSQKAQ